MAAKKKTLSRKPRTTRKNPVRAKSKAAAEALDNAKTIIHVHGIGNKPPAEVLKCQWDTALMGFDLGERSRLAYWVNRAYYPEPSKGSCATGDLVSSEDLNAVTATPDMTVGAASGSTDLSTEISRLAHDSAEKKTLQAIADRMQGPPSAAAAKAIQARRVEPKILPLPEPAHRWFTRKLTSAFLRDVRDFFYDADRRAFMMNSVIERIEPGGGPLCPRDHGSPP
jgi:hypothetical protein